VGRNVAKVVRRGHGALLGVAAIAILAASCGARVSPYLSSDGTSGGTNTQASGTNSGAASVTTTTGAATGTATGGVGSAGSSTGRIGSSAPGKTGAAATPGAAASGAAAASATPAASLASPSSAGFNFSPQQEAADCPGSTGNGASGPGVTASAINFGNVSGITGPLQGSFSQGSQGVEALFGAINSAGGICGRKLNLDAEDDQQNSTTNESDVADLIPNVLAFVGSTSDADNGGVAEMTQANIPDVGFAINCNRSEAPVYWGPAGGSCVQPNGPNGPYYIDNTAFAEAKQYGYLPAKMAFLSYSISISAQAAQQYEYVYQKLGGTVCYTDFSISPASASLESDVQSMQQKGCTGSFNTMDVTGNAKLLQAMQQQNYQQSYVAATFDAYTPDLIATAGQSAAQGLVVSLPFIPLNESQTMVQMYQQQLSTYEPGKQPSGFGFLAWISGQMLVYALIMSGHSPTRATLDHWFGTLTNWNGGGAIGPYTPSTRGDDLSEPGCAIDVSIQGNGFVRKSPSSGFYCGGQSVQASS
jgi:ABC-type branched-subunit amino acid transport system substrate-binding protein